MLMKFRNGVLALVYLAYLPTCSLLRWSRLAPARCHFRNTGRATSAVRSDRHPDRRAGNNWRLAGFGRRCLDGSVNVRRADEPGRLYWRVSAGLRVI